MARGSVNKVILIGRLGKNPEMRYTPSGLAVATFSLATNHSVKDQEGNFTDKTEWHNIVTYGKRAEFAGEYLEKGRQVFIEGRIQTRSWEDQNGQKRYMTEIICNDLQLLSSRSTGSDEANESAPEAASSEPDDKPEQNQEQAQDTEQQEDDLPF
jgi:single-strand DNA-binding protein